VSGLVVKKRSIQKKKGKQRWAEKLVSQSVLSATARKWIARNRGREPTENLSRNEQQKLTMRRGRGFKRIVGKKKNLKEPEERLCDFTSLGSEDCTKKKNSGQLSGEITAGKKREGKRINKSGEDWSGCFDGEVMSCSKQGGWRYVEAKTWLEVFRRTEKRSN